MCLLQKKKGKSTVLYRGFCLFDLETEQRVLQFLHAYCSDARNHCQLLNQINKIREAEL